MADGAATSSAEPERTCKVELEFLHQLTADHKIRSFDWTETGLVLGTTRNTLERCARRFPSRKAGWETPRPEANTTYNKAMEARKCAYCWGYARFAKN